MTKNYAAALSFGVLTAFAAPAAGAAEEQYIIDRESSERTSLTHHENIEELPNLGLAIHTPAAGEAPAPGSEKSVARYTDFFFDDHEDHFFNDEYFEHQWSHEFMDMPSIWEAALTDTEPVTVAVIDSGIDTEHNDLQNRLADGAYNAIDDSDDVTDLTGHGTQVAGIIAAEADNNFGIAGIAGTSPVEILPVKVSEDSGSSSSATMLRGVDYALEHDADIINISLGAPTFSDAEAIAMERAADDGALVVASSGNEGDTAPFYPASHDGVIAVGSHAEDGTLSNFSTHHDQVDIVAPGEELVTTHIQNDFVIATGTSFAAPVFAGFSALLLQNHEELTYTDVQQAALDHGQFQEQTTDLEAGPFSRLDAGRLWESVTYDPWDNGETAEVDSDHTWTITFSEPPAIDDPADVIEIAGSDGEPVENLEMALDGNEIHITAPPAGYNEDERYRLYVNDEITNEAGEPLPDGVYQIFQVK
ncbi:S8 family peptidase [Salsuginibacillus halophilus]|nr:S8 family serine peptidase [Salsuginibacillus halophilus]